MSSASSIIASILATSGIGATGLGGFYVIKWRNFENAHPTVDSVLSEEGFEWDPVTQESDWRRHDVRSKKRIEWENWGCFSRMFPNVTINHNESNEEVESINGRVKPTDEFRDDEIHKDYIGCAAMELQPIKTDEWSKYFYYFQAEIVVKGQDKAVALWVGFSNRPTRSKLIPEEGIKNKDRNDKRFDDALVYRVVGLSKDGSGNWNVVEGYQWSNYPEKYAVSESKGGFNIKIPGKDDYWFDGKRFKDRSYVYPRKWIGVWETVGEREDDEDAYGLLSDILVYRDSITRAEILGKGKYGNGEDTLFSVSEKDKNEFGYSKSTVYYDDNKGWIKRKEGKTADLSNWLDGWYGPFVKVKGRWTDLYDRCNNLSYQRDLKDASIDKIKHLCYSK